MTLLHVQSSGPDRYRGSSDGPAPSGRMRSSPAANCQSGHLPRWFCVGCRRSISRLRIANWFAGPACPQKQQKNGIFRFFYAGFRPRVVKKLDFWVDCLTGIQLGILVATHRSCSELSSPSDWHSLIPTVDRSRRSELIPCRIAQVIRWTLLDMIWISSGSFRGFHRL